MKEGPILIKRPKSAQSFRVLLCVRLQSGSQAKPPWNNGARLEPSKTHGIARKSSMRAILRRCVGLDPI